MESRRIVVTMGSSEAGDGLYVPNTRRGEQVELVEDLADALQSCFERPCERLYVSLLQATTSELTSLSLFRSMKRSQYIVLVVDRSLRPLVEELGLADEYLTFRN